MTIPMRLTSSTAPFAMLAALTLSTAAAASLVQPTQQQSCPTLDIDGPSAIKICDATGSVTINVHYPPAPTSTPVDSPDARMDGLVIAAIVVATVFVYQVLHMFSHWLSDHSSALSPASSGPGRTAAVASATPPGPKTISPTERRALAHESVEVVLLSRSSAPGHRASSNSWPESDPSPDSSPSIEATPLAQGYGHCSHHRSSIAAARIEESYRSILSPRRMIPIALIWPAAGLDGYLVIQPNLSISYPSIHHVIINSSSSENLESTGQNDDDVPPSPQPFINHPTSGHRASLTKSLTGHIIVAFSFLIVGLDWSHKDPNFPPLPGVTRDCEWFETIRAGFESFITLNPLPHVTPETIRSKILEMFNNARHGTAIVLYFNGHGEGDFVLYDHSHVNAATLVEWITAARKETRKYLPVTIIFDHCRFESPEQSFVDLGPGIHILYACMPGQRSADLMLAGGKDAYIPNSNFLKVCCLVLAEARTRATISVDDLTLRMNFWMEVVVRMTRAVECGGANCPTPCPICACPNFEECTHPAHSRHKIPWAYPRVQNPNGMFSGFEGGVCTRKLLEMLELDAKPFLDRIQDIAERIKGHIEAINDTTEPPGERNLFQPSSSHVPRGRNAGAARSVQPLPN